MWGKDPGWVHEVGLVIKWGILHLACLGLNADIIFELSNCIFYLSLYVTVSVT